ncbi:MAG TPA: hypothetical protein PLL10_10810, partial [Elusimicrobiales bacterium]|nr:hypothetical protein [Elusimicrobiales bacterium]
MLMRAIRLESPPLDVYRQMALDELTAEAFDGAHVLRCYRWSGKAVTFGYAQSLKEVCRALTGPARQWPLTRRPTGGGIVVHDQDLTFSCVFPAQENFRAENVYAVLHGALQKTLAASGVAVELKQGIVAGAAYAPSNGGLGSACFSNPVPQDLLGPGGEKILGGAIRRYGATVLYQGSLQLSGARSRAQELEAALAQGLSAVWGLDWTEARAGGEL